MVIFHYNHLCRYLLNGKDKVVPVNHNMWRSVSKIPHIFIPGTIWDWLALRSGGFTLGERDPSAKSISGWVGPRAIPDTVAKRKIPDPMKHRN